MSTSEGRPWRVTVTGSRRAMSLNSPRRFWKSLALVVGMAASRLTRRSVKYGKYVIGVKAAIYRTTVATHRRRRRHRLEPALRHDVQAVVRPAAHEYCRPRTRPSCRRRPSTPARLDLRATTRPAAGLAQIFLPDRGTDHLVLV